MNAEARVFITGAGIVCPIGIGRAQAWQSFVAGKTGLRKISTFDPAGLRAQVAGLIEGFEPADYVKPRKSMKVLARDAQLTVAAASLAREDSALGADAVDPDRFGVIFGGEVIRNPLTEVAEPFRGSIENGEYDFARWGTKGLAACYPLSMLKLLPNMPACHISIGHDARGPNNSICMAEASGVSAIGEALRVIERRQADVIMSGAASSRVNAYDLIRRQLSEEVTPSDDPEQACRPFDIDRDGQARGEGAAVLVMESEAHVAARGARVIAEVCGWGTAGEPLPEGQRRAGGKVLTGACIIAAVERALADAHMTPKEIGFVVAHGLGTRSGDLAEATALRTALPLVPVFAAKGYFGCMGVACGAVEAALAALALQAKHLPPTLHCDRPDPSCGVEVVHSGPLTTFEPACVVLSYTAAGQATAIVLRRA